MRAIRLLVLGLAVAAQGSAAAPYRAEQPVQGEVRIWGSPEDAVLIRLWEEGFRKHHPGARVVASLHGPESTMAGIYTGVADIAFVGRELRLPVENMAFEWVKLRKPVTVEIANAGLAAQRAAGSVAVFVHADNPLAGLTLAQLDGIFGAEHKRAPANIRTWGELGLGGEWRDRSIRVLAPRVDSPPALFFRKAVLGDSFKWNEGIEEYSSAATALEAVATEPSAIAYAPMAAARASVKAVPLAAVDGGAFVALDARTAADRSYPLARSVIVAFDRAQGKPLEPRVREFLRYVLSDDGQAAIARDGAYIPLQAKAAEKQLARLD